MASDRAVGLGPDQARAGLEVAPVQLAVRALLLDDEHVDPQGEQPVQRDRVDLVDRRVMQLHRSIESVAVGLRAGGVSGAEVAVGLAGAGVDAAKVRAHLGQRGRLRRRGPSRCRPAPAKPVLPARR